MLRFKFWATFLRIPLDLNASATGAFCLQRKRQTRQLGRHRRFPGDDVLRRWPRLRTSSPAKAVTAGLAHEFADCENHVVMITSSQSLRVAFSPTRGIHRIIGRLLAKEVKKTIDNKCFPVPTYVFIRRCVRRLYP